MNVLEYVSSLQNAFLSLYCRSFLLIFSFLLYVNFFECNCNCDCFTQSAFRKRTKWNEKKTFISKENFLLTFLLHFDQRVNASICEWKRLACAHVDYSNRFYYYIRRVAQSFGCMKFTRTFYCEIQLKFAHQKRNRKRRIEKSDAIWFGHDRYLFSIWKKGKSCAMIGITFKYHAKNFCF